MRLEGRKSSIFQDHQEHRPGGWYAVHSCYRQVAPCCSVGHKGGFKAPAPARTSALQMPQENLAPNKKGISYEGSVTLGRFPAPEDIMDVGIGWAKSWECV